MMNKLAKRESALRKALPVAAAAALPLLLSRRAMGGLGRLTTLPVLAGLGSTLLQRDNASLPFLLPFAGAYAGRQLGSAAARKLVAGKLLRAGKASAASAVRRTPLFLIGEGFARSNPKSLLGGLVLGSTAAGGAVGAHMGNK
jgi:hypothetical protein